MGAEFGEGDAQSRCCGRAAAVVVVVVALGGRALDVVVNGRGYALWVVEAIVAEKVVVADTEFC